MRATVNLPPSVRLIEAALEGLVQVNRVLIETGVVPPSPLDAGVRYKREGSGLEEWDNALTCIKRGWGDCEDLNAWECARINIDEDPEAICTLIQTGKRLFHCVILMSDGSHRDVCPDLGMRVPGTNLEGIPWVETRAENIIGAKPYVPRPSGVRRTDRQRRTQIARRNPHSRFNNEYVKANRYNPKPSGRTQSSAPAYQPKSSRSTPRTQRDQEQEAFEQEQAAMAQQLTTPTSMATPQAMMTEPMYDDAALDEEMMDDVEDPEAFDEEMESDDGEEMP